jgi:hypothetical protein
VTWSTNGGSIAPGGVWTAPDVPGTYNEAYLSHRIRTMHRMKFKYAADAGSFLGLIASSMISQVSLAPDLVGAIEKNYLYTKTIPGSNYAPNH